MINRFQNELLQLKEQNLYRQLNESQSITSRTVVKNGQLLLNFVSNNYLNLNNHPQIKKEAQAYLAEFGTGSSGSRLLGGSYEYQSALEKELAAFKNKEAALIFNAGYNANLAMASVFSHSQTHIFSDKMNHASIYDGISLGQGKLHRYQHNDLKHLESLLEKYGPERIVITESLFSMDGDFAYLEELAFLCKKHKALFFVDEAHAEGIYGPEGRGLLFAQNLAPAADLILGSFGKAYGAFGAYLSGNQILIDYLKNKARSFIYTTALPPASIGAMKGALDVCRQADEAREKLSSLSRYLRQHLQIKGWDILQSESHIIPILLGDTAKCLSLQEHLLRKGIWVQVVREPTVPRGASRLRINVNADHSYEDLDLFLHELGTWEWK